jgi:23S rRNA (adenine2503-C2)-methyltransferase
MKVKSAAGNPGIATVYLAEMDNGKYIEFVESIQPPVPKEEKWVLIVSTLYGCPVGCSICDAGGWYDGPLSAGDILAQVDYLVTRSFPDREVPASKFKIQFARMGEPALNPNVLEVLDTLPSLYRAPGLMPSLSTIAPNSTGQFFESLLDIKQNRYTNGKFQLQFSLHSTDSEQRDRWIPVKKWSFDQIARYAERFYQPGDRKVTLNFALAEDTALDPDVLLEYFDPRRFIIKLTPVNPTIRATGSGIVNAVTGDKPGSEPPAAIALRQKGYDAIVSIGHLEENKIGSNCGQYVRRFMENNQQAPPNSYRYQPIVL